MAAHQAPPSLGFPRQEHWSGLPCPSPVLIESEKWKWSGSVMSNSEGPHRLQPTRLLHPWDFPGKSTGVGCHCILHRLSRWRQEVELIWASPTSRQEKWDPEPRWNGWLWTRAGTYFGHESPGKAILFLVLKWEEDSSHARDQHDTQKCYGNKTSAYTFRIKPKKLSKNKKLKSQ